MNTGNKQNVSKLTNQLLRGASHDDLTGVYSAYKQLYQIGSPAVPYLEKIVLKADWPAPKYGFEVKWLAILLSLIYELDHAAGNDVAAKFLKGRSHFALKTVANAVNKEQNWPYRKYQIKQVNIYEDSTINLNYNIESHLVRWLDTIPEEHLQGLQRLNIIAQPYNADYLGNYSPLLGIINLIWHYRTPFHALERIDFKQTLYHEIGHHLYGHRGQDPLQERLADRYAAQIIHRTRPAWNKALRRAIRRMKTRLSPRNR